MTSIVSATFLADTWTHGVGLDTHFSSRTSDAAATFAGIQGTGDRSLPAAGCLDCSRGVGQPAQHQLRAQMGQSPPRAGAAGDVSEG